MTAPAPSVPDALQHLRDRVAAVRLGLAVPGRDDAERAARGIVDQVDDYLLPRLRDLDAPLLTVVGGSTGAGKSTLVNSLLGTSVTASGVLRPTTRAPVLVCAPADRAAFAGDRVLPGLSRTTGPVDAADPHGGLRLVVHEELPPGLALARRPGRRLGGGGQPRPGRSTARRGGPVGVRDHRGPLRRRRPLGPAAHRRLARHRRSRSSWTGCRPRRWPRWPTTWPGCCAAPA